MAAPTISDTKQGGPEPEGDQEAYDLLVVGPEHTASTPLPKSGDILIGREEAADVRLIDPLASRSHARLYLAPPFELEDLGSGNGTVLRDQRLTPHQRVTLEPGEAITIGSTVLVVQRRRRALRPRQIWPHGYFETRLIEQCARGEQLRQHFAVLRVHVGRDVDPATCERLLTASVRSGDVLALYGPGEYEILLVDSSQAQSEALPQPGAARCWPAPASERAAGWRVFPSRRDRSAGPGQQGLRTAARRRQRLRRAAAVRW